MARLLISGVSSGCGKTTVTNALLRIWKKQGMNLCAFKNGPDYIDPMFHQSVLGIPSYNLDLYFLSEKAVCSLLAHHLQHKDLGLIEGAMGFYDGVSGEFASSAHLGRVTQTPTILVVRPKGQSLSLAATIQGFLNFAPNSIAGVILNGISKEMYPFYQEIVKKAGVCCYGFLPDMAQFELPSRHLGLVTAQEIVGLEEKLDLLAEIAQQTLDLEGLKRVAQSATPLPVQSALPLQSLEQSVKIGIAKDKAFCFYYQDNLDILEQLGAQLIPFSPMFDRQIAQEIDGCYLGGGYPEIYAKQLSENQTFRDSLKKRIKSGMPVIAECGGFMYLQQFLNTPEQSFPMVGVLSGSSQMSKRLQNFGYAQMTAQSSGLLCEKGQSIPIHEFHYSQSQQNGLDFLIKKPNGKEWIGGVHTQTMYAGYPHLYFGANPQMAVQFLKTCLEKRLKC